MTLPGSRNLFGAPVSHIHCVGVAGMGMGPLAIFLSGAGFSVSGEDDGMTDAMVSQLTRAGVRIGPMGEACELVVHSSAIRAGHPARCAASARHLPMVRRGELLAELAKSYNLVAVCGSHGKTTTTAMLVTALRAAGFPCGYVLGGLFGDAGIPPARVGANGWLVAEIDESDGTIGNFAPAVTLAVNLDWDHPDFYREQADLERAFGGLFARTTQAVIVNRHCALSAKVSPSTAVTFGGAGADFAGEVVAACGENMRLRLGGRFSITEAVVRARGDFNAVNATAALAAAQVVGAKLSHEALANYPGVRRRQCLVPAESGLTVIEDYAHHPGEIRALLESLRARVRGGEASRLVVAFQPHRFSRTAQFIDGFSDALALGDLVVLLDTYGAGELPTAGATTADLRDALARRVPGCPVFYQPGAVAFLDALGRELRPGDLLAVVGAGDIDSLVKPWLTRRRWQSLADALTPVLSVDAIVRHEEPLAPRTTMRVGGCARLYAEPASETDLSALLRTASAQGAPVFVLGRGSNVIVPDDGVEALVISLSHPAWAGFEMCADGSVRAGAGLRLKNLCGLAAKAGLGGFEFLEGIPGCLGGALRMNAGAMGAWLFDVVESVRFMSRDGRIHTRRRDELSVVYRCCRELVDAIVLEAVLRPMAVAEADAIQGKMEAYRAKRQASQPREASAGCVFKNPEGDAAGRLIDACGLKGLRVGDAEVSQVHANFIVNHGAARASDVLALIREVRGRVQAEKGVTLEPEVLLVGRDWQDFL